MTKENLALGTTADHVMSVCAETGAPLIRDLIKTRELSSVMEDLNRQLIDGTPLEKERARMAIRQLGFATDLEC